MARKKTKSIDEKYMGTSEPRGLISNDTDMVLALNWYNYYKDTADAKAYVMAAVDPAIAKKLHNVPDSEFRTVGWLYRMVSNGIDLGPYQGRPQQIVDRLLARYPNVKKEVMAENEPQFVASAPNPAKRAKRKNLAILADLEGEVDNYIRDNKFKFDPYKWMTKRGVTNVGAKLIMQHYERWAKEDKFIEAIYKAANTLVGNAKIVRKTRKKKPVAAVKLVERLQYQKEDTNLRLTSISPTDIINATELWIYNTEKRLLAVYRGKLTVKGTTINGWDEKQSLVKKLRKPEVMIEKFRGAGVRAMTKAFNELSTKAQPCVTGRTNKNTVLLRAQH